MVASRATATANPKPICCNPTSGPAAKPAKTATMMAAAQREVMAAIARGSSNAEISEELFIGAATVKSHVSSILTKLGLRGRAQVVVFAYESGLVEAGDLDIGH
jgi:DNA-binding NarL/FixJ family response regulator